MWCVPFVFITVSKVSATNWSLPWHLWPVLAESDALCSKCLQQMERKLSGLVQEATTLKVVAYFNVSPPLLLQHHWAPGHSVWDPQSQCLFSFWFWGAHREVLCFLSPMESMHSSPQGHSMTWGWRIIFTVGHLHGGGPRVWIPSQGQTTRSNISVYLQ